jgi:hypothetical protein
MRTNKNAHLTRKQEEIVEANFGLETIMVWVNNKARKYGKLYRKYNKDQEYGVQTSIQKEILDDFISNELSRIKWSKHHSKNIREEIHFNAQAKVRDGMTNYFSYKNFFGISHLAGEEKTVKKDTMTKDDFLSYMES